MAGGLLVIATASGLGAFVGIDRTLAGARQALAGHALAATLGLLSVEIVLAAAFGLAGLQDGMTDLIILASILAGPVGLFARFLSRILGPTGAEPSGDLISFTSAAWIGAACLAGSWRLDLVCLLVLVFVQILRPRAEEPERTPSGAEAVRLTPMAPRIMRPDVGAPVIAQAAAGETGLAREPQPIVSSQPARPMSRRGHHLRDPRMVRGYSLRHHRQSGRAAIG